MTFSVSSTATRCEVVFDDGGVNRLTRRCLSELAAIVRDADNTGRLLVLRSGRPGVFAAGADMGEMKDFGWQEADSFARAGQELMTTLERSSCASVAVIDGDCLGGAFDLALAFDIRIATLRSRFAHPGARLGIVTGFGGTARLPRQLGARAAASVLLSGRRLDAESARTEGLVDFLVGDGHDPEIESLLLACEARCRGISLARQLAAAAPALDDRQLSLLSRRLGAIAQYN